MPHNLIQRDLNHVWHPASNMRDFTTIPPLVIERAQGSYLYTDQGPMIDAISSWWCKSLGHGHPAIIAAIQSQLTKFEHVISANTTHQAMVELAEDLTSISKKQHVFFACDGSSAVEISLKIAFQAQQIAGNTTRTKFMSLKNGYHGETLGALSVSNVEPYSSQLSAYGLDCHFIEPIPYVHDQTDPIWSNSEAAWSGLEPTLDAYKHTVCALILEPIVQGAGGMRCYSADFLRRLTLWAQQNSIYVISDEIMTGLGRTGKWLAVDHAGIEADMICLSKGLTAGTLPLSCVLIDHVIYDLFYQSDDPRTAFLHSHTYSGHPLAICAARATLQTLRTEDLITHANVLGEHMKKCFVEIAQNTGYLENVRSIGAWVAADLIACKHARPAQVLAYEAQKRGALLRPLDNTLYWLPPLNIELSTLDNLSQITMDSLRAVYV